MIIFWYRGAVLGISYLVITVTTTIQKKSKVHNVIMWEIWKYVQNVICFGQWLSSTSFWTRSKPFDKDSRKYFTLLNLQIKKGNAFYFEESYVQRAENVARYFPLKPRDACCGAWRCEQNMWIPLVAFLSTPLCVPIKT